MINWNSVFNNNAPALQALGAIADWHGRPYGSIACVRSWTMPWIIRHPQTRAPNKTGSFNP